LSLLRQVRPLEPDVTFAENPGAKGVAALPKSMPVMHLPSVPCGTLYIAAKRADIFIERKVVEMGLLAPTVTFAGLQRVPRAIRCSANTHASIISEQRVAVMGQHASAAIFASGRGKLIRSRSRMRLSQLGLANKYFPMQAAQARALSHAQSVFFFRAINSKFIFKFQVFRLLAHSSLAARHSHNRLAECVIVS